MRTLIAAAEPPERPAAGPTVTVGGPSTSTTADAVLAFVSSTGVTVTPWQAVVIRQAYTVRGLYRA